MPPPNAPRPAPAAQPPEKPFLSPSLSPVREQGRRRPTTFFKPPRILFVSKATPARHASGGRSPWCVGGGGFVAQLAQGCGEHAPRGVACSLSLLKQDPGKVNKAYSELGGLLAKRPARARARATRLRVRSACVLWVAKEE